jgi:hypothetical protein
MEGINFKLLLVLSPQIKVILHTKVLLEIELLLQQ